MRYVIITLDTPSLRTGPVRPVFCWFGVDHFLSLFGGIGPPGQVKAVAGKKEGMKQGAIGGILKELGYTEDQVFKF